MTHTNIDIEGHLRSPNLSKAIIFFSVAGEIPLKRIDREDFILLKLSLSYIHGGGQMLGLEKV